MSHIYATLSDPQEIERALQDLVTYYGWRSDQLSRYAAHFLATLRLTSRIKFVDRRNTAEEVRPRFAQLRREGSSGLSPRIASLHGGMQ